MRRLECAGNGELSRNGKFCRCAEGRLQALAAIGARTTLMTDPNHPAGTPFDAASIRYCASPYGICLGVSSLGNGEARKTKKH